MSQTRDYPHYGHCLLCDTSSDLNNRLLCRFCEQEVTQLRVALEKAIILEFDRLLELARKRRLEADRKRAQR